MKLFFSIPIFILLFYINIKASSNIKLENIHQIKIEYFEYEEFPKIKYLKPCVEEWIKQLKPITDISESDKYIKITYENKQIEYIELFQGSFTPLRKEKYTILKDSIKMEFEGLSVSQPGYKLYVYKNELLFEESTYVVCLKSEYCMFSKFHYEYLHTASNPKYIYKYFYLKEFAGCDQNYKEEYDEHGKFIRKEQLNE